MNDTLPASVVQREVLLHTLYEAAELEHDLMCTYLYAAASLKDGPGEGLSAAEADAVRRWREAILSIAIDEMGHLVAVWNITSALGGSPHVGRGNFPLDPGVLPAGITVKLAPFNADTLQHFIFLERPLGSTEPEGEGFSAAQPYVRGSNRTYLTPMARDYETVGAFYEQLGRGLRAFVEKEGEAIAFDGDPALQISDTEVNLPGARRVQCLKTALDAFSAIVRQGEGAPQDVSDSHFQRFVAIREELQALQAANPGFKAAFPAATNPVLRRPPRPEGRVWIEDEAAFATVDLANACYGLMQRLLAYTYTLPGPREEKTLALDLAIGLMRAVMPLAERAARLPAGPSNPNCNAGVSFITLRDAAPLPVGPAARRMFTERFADIARTAAGLAEQGDARIGSAAAVLTGLYARAKQEFERMNTSEQKPAPAASAAAATVAPTTVANTAPPTGGDGVERVAGRQIDLEFEAKRCIHSRFCVTWTPDVFLANVQGPWIHPDAMPVAAVVEVAHACPSGAIRYRRSDGGPQESAPPVNLASVREGGPYAFRADIRLNGQPAGYRMTLCRCGASKNKPFCDGSHHEVGFSATGEPPTGKTDMLPVRDGPLAIDPQPNGPLRVRGNLEIISGTGRCVARGTSAYLCRCGASANKPFCDGTHSNIGFSAP